MNTAVMFSSKSPHWNTPADLYQSLDDEFHFTLDPCPEDPKFDGLSFSWEGSVYINPPYGREISKWVGKAFRSTLIDDTVCVMLLPARTDTRWWHEYVMKASEIRLIRGRLKFGNQTNSAPFPSAIVIFRGSERQCNPKFRSVNTIGR